MKYILILGFAVALAIGCSTHPTVRYRSLTPAETEDAAKTLVEVTQANHLSEVLVGEIRTSAADPASDFAAKMANYINAPLTFCAGSANGARCWYLRPGNPPAMCADRRCNDVKAGTASH